ncbi:thioesterase domain-containing protein [Nonomuraea sp. NPDC048892]|uniref:lipase/acyltransferase domain-containing protein n=1 Tax=Nonomuraea sp. NPDC048892 TaxID=3154624 RepID=UPI0033D10EE9
MARIGNGDLIVVVPGILGSTLYRDGRQTWGYRNISWNLYRLTARLTEDLSLPPEAFADPALGCDDGTQVRGVLKTLGIVPGFLTIDGYDKLLRRLRARFRDDHHTIIEFPYDWRQSNEYTARRLQTVVEPILERRRQIHPDAGIVFFCHSMGGLVARFYAECLDTRKLTRRIITIGTPYSGAAKALGVLANGYAPLGSWRIRLGELARSLPSVAELLPMYACVGPSVHALAPLVSEPVPGLPDICLERGLRFHRRIEEAIAANGNARPSYHAILSHRQTTETWASITDDGSTILHAPSNFEERGDGTVPRCSATPPEWADDSNALFVAGRHAALQQQNSVIIQAEGIVTTRRRPMAAMDEIAVDADLHIEPGGAWEVRAESIEGSDRLVLFVTVTDPDDGRVGVSRSLRPEGDSRYSARIPIAGPGVFRWTVHTAPTAATPVDPVSDVLLCTDEEV